MKKKNLSLFKIVGSSLEIENVSRDFYSKTFIGNKCAIDLKKYNTTQSKLLQSPNVCTLLSTKWTFPFPYPHFKNTTLLKPVSHISYNDENWYFYTLAKEDQTNI